MITTWQYTTMVPTAVAAPFAKYVAVGQYGSIYISIDGANWDWKGVTVDNGTGFGNTDIHCIIYAAGKYVACAASSTVGYSANGIDWSVYTVPGGYDFRSISYLASTNKFYMVASTGTVFYSSDLRTWNTFASGVTGTNATYKAATSTNVIGYAGDSTNTKMISITAPGNTVSSFTTGFGAAPNQLKAVSYLNNTWITGGQGFKVSTSSPDANGAPTGWSLVRAATTLGTNSCIRSIIYDSTRNTYIALGSTGTTGMAGNPLLSKTTDVNTWPNTPTNISAQIGTGNFINDAVAIPGGGGLIATGDCAWITTDWITFNRSYFNGGICYSVAAKS